MSVNRKTIAIGEEGTVMIQEHHRDKSSFFQIDLYWPNHVFSPDALKKIVDVFEDYQLSQWGPCSYSCNPTAVVSPKFLAPAFSRVSIEVLGIIQAEESYRRL